MKVYSAVILNALVDALRTIYWFQNDLRSFLTRAGVPADVLGALPWGPGTYKRIIAQRLVDQLAGEPAVGMPILNGIIDSVVEMDEDMPHLVRLDDGKKKADDARRAVRALKDLLGRETIAERADRARREARTEAERSRVARIQRQRDLKALNDRFLALSMIPDDAASKRRRGFQFQELLRDLFALHDMDPRGSMARPGEQIDGSIVFDGSFLVVEAKWEAKPIEPKDVRDFQGKVQTKLDNTLGLFVSMSGFTDYAVEEAARSGRIYAVLMDGSDLAQVFQGLVDLTELLRRKLRHAAEYGRAMYHVGDD
ncbi:restriction endonuclease [Polyangium spumosum]|nr:restriction endonuclease [Polyangium spumosum]